MGNGLKERNRRHYCSKANRSSERKKKKKRIKGDECVASLHQNASFTENNDHKKQQKIITV